MFKLFKYLLLLAVAVIVIPTGYFVGPFLTTTSADNVQTRLKRVCSAAALMSAWDRRLHPRRAMIRIDFSDCQCVAADAVKTLGAPLAAQSVENVRQAVISFVARGGKADPGWSSEGLKSAEMAGNALEGALKTCQQATRA